MRARGYVVVAGVVLGLAGLFYLSSRGRSAVAIAAGDGEVAADDAREAAFDRSSSDEPAGDPSGAVARPGPQRPRATPEQRERARLAREKILEAARRWPGASERSGGGARPAAAGAAEPPPVLDREYIGQHIRENFFPLAKDCYESLLASQPKAGGLVEIHMTLVGDEAVGSVVDSLELGEKSTMKDDEFLDCVSESMMSMVFEPPPEHGWVTVVYPVEFAPGDDAG